MADIHLSSRTARFAGLLLLAVTLVVSGCGRKPEVPGERPYPFPTGAYQTVWVNPQIIISDSLITLIEAERIDSLPAESIRFPLNEPPAVGFAVTKGECEVVINLTDDNLRVVYPLLVQRLPYGFYKLSFSPEAIKKPSLAPGIYFLRAAYCGLVETVPFSVD